MEDEKPSVTRVSDVMTEVYKDGLQTTFGWRPGTHHSGLDRHSYLWERGIHDLDLLRFVFAAEPVRVWSHSFNPSWSPYAGGAAVQGWIEFAGGISFGLLTTFASHGKGSSLRIEGTEGMLELQGGEHPREDPDSQRQASYQDCVAGHPEGLKISFSKR